MKTSSPLGDLYVLCGPSPSGAVVVHAARFGGPPELPPAWDDSELPLLREADPLGVSEVLARYWAGELSALSELPLAAPQPGLFGEVQALLDDIPPGETRSYGELAQAVGKPKAAQAVGQAVHRNPISLLRPCHRVVGTDGRLTGYASGMARKRHLLRHEGALDGGRQTGQLGFGF